MGRATNLETNFPGTSSNEKSMTTAQFRSVLALAAWLGAAYLGYWLAVLADDVWLRALVYPGVHHHRKMARGLVGFEGM